MSDITERLRAPTNWLRQGPGPWKDATNEYDRTPYDAAAMIQQVAYRKERACESKSIAEANHPVIF